MVDLQTDRRFFSRGATRRPLFRLLRSSEAANEPAAMPVAEAGPRLTPISRWQKLSCPNRSRFPCSCQPSSCQTARADVRPSFCLDDSANAVAYTARSLGSSIRSERRSGLAGSDAAEGVGGLLDGAADGGALLPALQDHAALRVGSAGVAPVLLAVRFGGQLQGVDVDLVDFV
jgi:hypothetical protein